MICIPIKFSSSTMLLKNFGKAQKKGDIVEIWFDELSLTDQELKKIFKAKKKPVIYKAAGHSRQIGRILDFGCEYLDLDLDTERKIISNIKKKYPKTKIILSFHDFEKTPTDNALKAIGNKMLKSGADVLKLACHATSIGDSLRMLSFLEKLVSEGKKAICLCMGREGRLTRLAGHLFGNLLMYAPLTSGSKTAPGQLKVEEIKQEQTLLKNLCH